MKLIQRMKRNGLYGAACALSLLLSSCLGDGGDGITLAAQAGVVSANPVQMINLKGGDKISSESFQKEKHEDGSCFLVDFSVDYTSADNSEGGLKEHGYYTAEILQKIPVEQWTVANALTDTSKVLLNEIPTSSIYSRNAYIKGRMFLFSEYHNIPENQELAFDLSYDAALPTMKVDEERKAYVLYLRATKKSEGAEGETSNVLVPNAFDMEGFFSKVRTKEKNTEDMQVNIVVVYVNAIDEALQKPILAVSSPITVDILKTN